MIAPDPSLPLLPPLRSDIRDDPPIPPVIKKRISVREPVVRGLIGDQDVMGMTLRPAGTGDPDKPGLLMHLGDSP